MLYFVALVFVAALARPCRVLFGHAANFLLNIICVPLPYPLKAYIAGIGSGIAAVASAVVVSFYSFKLGVREPFGIVPLLAALVPLLFAFAKSVSLSKKFLKLRSDLGESAKNEQYAAMARGFKISIIGDILGQITCVGWFVWWVNR